MHTQDGPLRLLFVARAFPPTLGGMETLAERLSTAMRTQADVTMLVNHRGKKALPAFLPYAVAAGVRLARRERVQAIHLGDALLAPVGLALRKLTGLPVTSTVCGLDVTFPNRAYQAAIPRALSKLDMTMPISEATEAELHARSGAGTPSTVIPLGVNPLARADDEAVLELKRRAHVNGHSAILLTVGRLVERKGVAWFVEHVLPRLQPDALYLVVGEGKEAETIRAVAVRAGVSDRVRMLGRVPSEVLAAAYRAADVFVMPNVPVAGDMEGFGLVALEAAASGLPVVASDLEGITAAVHHERNGLLVPPRSADAYAETLCGLLSLPKGQRQHLGESFSDYTLRTYGWDSAATRYLDVIREVTLRRT